MDSPGSELLRRFVNEPDWTPAKGTHLLPLKYFGQDRSQDPVEYLEVIKILTVANLKVAVTRGGGLFVRNNGAYERRQALEELVDNLNLLLAEFAIQGLACHPVTDLEVQDGKIIDRYAAIVGGWGNFGERTWGPFSLLASSPCDMGASLPSRNRYWPVNFYWTPQDPRILDRVDNTPQAAKLRDISPTLPHLLVAATYNAERHNLPEEIADAWVVTEELLSFHWDAFVSEQAEDARRDRLADSRTYSAAVRIEVLLVAGRLPHELCTQLHAARKVRNELAHRGRISARAAEVASYAMRSMLSFSGIETGLLPTYSRSSGSGPAPRIVLEPGFSFGDD